MAESAGNWVISTLCSLTCRAAPMKDLDLPKTRQLNILGQIHTQGISRLCHAHGTAAEPRFWQQ